MTMKCVLAGVALAAGMIALSACSPETGMSGEELFTQHCAGCHPNGGNTIKPGKTLHKEDLQAANLNSPGDIVGIMRNPGAGMPRFSRSVITDSDARKIAKYILATF